METQKPPSRSPERLPPNLAGEFHNPGVKFRIQSRAGLELYVVQYHTPSICALPPIESPQDRRKVPRHEPATPYLQLLAFAEQAALAKRQSPLE